MHRAPKEPGRFPLFPALPDPTVLEDRAVAAAEADDAVEFAPDALQPPLAKAHAALGPERPHAQAALPAAHVDTPDQPVTL